MKGVSFDHVIKAIERGTASEELAIIEELIEDAEDSDIISQLESCAAAIYLSLEMTSAALSSCEKAVYCDYSNTMAILLCGLCYLWTDQEANALFEFDQILKSPCEIGLFAFTLTLMNDIDLRSHVISLQFNVPAVIRLSTQWMEIPKYLENQEKRGNILLIKKSTQHAIHCFSTILLQDPYNVNALSGRGIAFCMASKWEKAYYDLKNAKNMDPSSLLIRRYLALALTALGLNSEAVCELTFIIDSNYTLFEPRFERAKIQMVRRRFHLALQDFSLIPEQWINEYVWSYTAECHYQTGMLWPAKSAIEKSAHVEGIKGYFCHFLILRELGKIDEAIEMLEKVITLQYTDIHLGEAMQFYYEIGNYEEVKKIYEMCPRLAYSLLPIIIAAEFCVGNYLTAQKKANEEMNKFVDDILEPRASDFLESKIPSLYELRETLNSIVYRLGSTFQPHLENHPEDQIPESLVEDIGTLGSKCLPPMFCYHTNDRTIRAFGMCVLLLVYFNEQPTQWDSVLATIVDIIMFADPITGIMNIHRVPKYIINSGERRSPRFGHMHSLVFERIAEEHRMNNPFDEVSCPEQVLFHTPKITTTRAMVFPDFSFPGVNVTLQTAYPSGYDLFITPPSNSYAYYGKVMDSLWSSLWSYKGKDIPIRLALLVVLVWISQPLGAFSHEFGHMLIHAYLISHGFSAKRIVQLMNDAFISQMIVPDVQSVHQAIVASIEENGDPGKYLESVAFWRSNPTILRILDVLMCV